MKILSGFNKLFSKKERGRKLLLRLADKNNSIKFVYEYKKYPFFLLFLFFSLLFYILIVGNNLPFVDLESKFLTVIFGVFIIINIALFFVIFCDIFYSRQIPKIKNIIDVTVLMKKNKIKNFRDLYLEMLKELSEGEIRDNLIKLINYSISQRYYKEFVQAAEKVNISEIDIIKEVVKRDDLSLFLLKIDLESRLKIFFSNELSCTIKETLSEEDMNHIKESIVSYDIEDYLENELSGYNSELYEIAKDRECDENHIAMLAGRIIKERKGLGVDLLADSGDKLLTAGGLDFKNKNILKF